MRCGERKFGLSDNNSALAASRNSGLRRKAEGLTGSVAGFIDKRFPSVTPNHLTIFGTVTALGGAALATFSKHRLIGGALFSAGAAMDGFDGSLARIKDAKGERTQEQKDAGVLFDVANDRYQELGASLLRMVKGVASGSVFRVMAESLNLTTNVKPSVARAKAEMKGVVVQETGNNPLEFAGSRPDRVLLGALALAFPSLAPLLMTTVAAGSHLNARSRMRAVNSADDDCHNPDPAIEQKLDALRRLDRSATLLGCVGLIGAGVVTFKSNIQKR